MLNWSLGLSLLLFIQTSCKNKPVAEQIEGKWLMIEVLQYDRDVTAEHNPNSDRWIRFYGDKTFKSDGTPFGENHGTWYLKSGDRVLYINSSVDNDDSEWNLTFSADRMQWTGIGDPGKEAYTLIFKKSEK